MQFYLPARRRNPAPKLMRPLSATLESDTGRGRATATFVSETDEVRNGSGWGSPVMSAEMCSLDAWMRSVIGLSLSIIL